MTSELMEIPSVNIKSVGAFELQALDITKVAQSVVIVNQAQYEQAVALRKLIKTVDAAAEVERKKMVDPINVAKDAIQNFWNPIKLRLENAKRLVEGKIDQYEQEQERKLLEAEAELRRKAEAEEARRRKIKEEQEMVWREKEAAAAAELARQNELIAKAKNEKAKAEAEAAAARAKAEQEKAARLAEERRQQAAEIQVIAPTLAPSIQKVEGTSSRELWTAEVVDMAALVKAVAEGKAPLGWLKVDQVALNKQASATKNSLQFPGIKFIVKRVQIDRG